MLLKLLINAGLILATVANDANEYSKKCSLDYALDYRLPSDVVPRHYNIMLKLKKYYFFGQINTSVEVTRRTANMTFHGYNLDVFHKTIRLVKHQRSNNDQYTLAKWKEFYYCNKSQVFILKFYKELSPGNYTLSMKFRRILRSSHDFVTSNLSATLGGEFAYVTLFERTGARRLFPCWDEPTFKATFKISVDHSPTVQVFSNMPRKNETVKSQRKLTIFETTPMMSTYLVTIAIMESTVDYVTEDNVELWVKIIAEEHVRDVLRIAKLVDNFLNGYTNDLWKYMRIEILGYPKLPSTAVGAWGFAVFREEDLIYKPNLHFSGRMLEVWEKVASQMIRQCIETFVSPKEWSHLWLSHAFAIFLSYKIIEKNYNRDVMMQLFVVQILQPALHNDIALNVPPITHEYDPIYSPLIYKKASALIRMMQHIVTEQVLQRALAQYLRTYAYGSATPTDFLRILDDELYRSQKINNFNMTEVMRVWLSERHYPTVTLHNVATKLASVVPSSNSKWPIPVTYTNESELYTRYSSIIWLNNNSSRQGDNYIYIFGDDPDNSLILNDEQFGYYRVNYQEENLERIATFLNTKDHTIIDVLNRAQIIDDAYHFVMEGKIKCQVFYKLIKYLRKETNFIIWHTMMNILQYMSPFFNFREGLYVRKFMLNIVKNVSNILGYNEDPLDDSMRKATRLLLLNWACKHGHVECRKKARDKLLAHLKDPENNKILPGWKDWTYCAGLMDADKETLSMSLRNILFEQNEDMLQHLDCIDDENLLKHLVVLTSSTHYYGKWAEIGSVRLRKLYHSLVKKHARKPEVLEFILTDFDRILQGRMSNMEKIADIIMSVYSNYHLNKILKYVDKERKWDIEATREVQRLIMFRRRQISRQRKLFTRRFHGDDVIDY